MDFYVWQKKKLQSLWSCLTLGWKVIPIYDKISLSVFGLAEDNNQTNCLNSFIIVYRRATLHPCCRESTKETSITIEIFVSSSGSELRWVCWICIYWLPAQKQKIHDYTYSFVSTSKLFISNRIFSFATRARLEKFL